ncbi:MAG TPA: F0F1 ATP synthase subunit gamma [Nocardioidaceae bacterium]|jgi:F-type H+-transporting ATPase subunit gamma|nr:F0F1 ATP synthase subunit gamma [Nocardioidaceae bacterium]
MAGTLRILRRRIRAVTQTKQITKAMELVATSRIAKAQQRVEAALPYTNELTRALSALASNSNTDHPLLVERPNPRRAAILVITSDRGLAGAYSSNALRTANGLESLLREEGKEPVRYVIGRKGSAYYRFRSREVAKEWTGFSEQPAFTDARDVGSTLVKAFLAGIDDSDDSDDGEGDRDGDRDGVVGVDEIHIVYTEFKSMLSQNPTAMRIAPLVVEESEEEAPEGYLPAYEFEPEPDELLGALLPKYVNARIYAALLESAASESASRRRAMKSATDNAEELIKTYTREANQARQAEITQEISEIVGGADALAAAGSERS